MLSPIYSLINGQIITNKKENKQICRRNIRAHNQYSIRVKSITVKLSFATRYKMKWEQGCEKLANLKRKIICCLQYAHPLPIRNASLDSDLFELNGMLHFDHQ